jgi:preprotein translocase subunit YajC
METGRVLVLPSRKYRKGDRVISWHGIKGTVTKTQTIINNVAPHHRVFVVMDDNPEMIRTLEGAEYNFHRA